LIRPDWVKSEDGKERPSSQAFSNSKEDGSMSVFLEDQIAAEGSTIEDILKKQPGYRACWWTAKELRNEFGQVIAREPVDDFPGHGGVKHTTGTSRPGSVRTKMAIKARWHDAENVPESD
jgi:hypothetical protein